MVAPLFKSSGAAKRICRGVTAPTDFGSGVVVRSIKTKNPFKLALLERVASL